MYVCIYIYIYMYLKREKEREREREREKDRRIKDRRQTDKRNKQYAKHVHELLNAVGIGGQPFGNRGDILRCNVTAGENYML